MNGKQKANVSDKGKIRLFRGAIRDGALRGTCLLGVWLMILCNSAIALAETGLLTHRLRFFIHPDLTQGLADGEVKSRLELYAADLNVIFSKNTIRRFAFDPEADITVTDHFPQVGWAATLPEQDYEIWAFVNPSASTSILQSHGGYMSFCSEGAGVAAGMYWDALHDRVALVNAAPDDWNLRNYWIQIHNLAHELGHVFGVAYGEYYSLRTVPDTTGVAPLENILCNKYDMQPADSYWSRRRDYLTDPMFTWRPWLTLSELTNQVRFSNVTAAMINAGFRSFHPVNRSLPDLAATKVWIRTSGSQRPLPDTPVKVWKVQTCNGNASSQIFDGVTDASGAVQFAWDGALNNLDSLILIKAYPAAVPPLVQWFSIYDAQEQKMVFGRDDLNIYLDAAAPANTQPLLTIRPSASGAVVAWPADATGFVLESTASLSAPDWQPVEQTPADDGTEKSVTWPMNEVSRVFRLKQRL